LCLRLVIFKMPIQILKFSSLTLLMVLVIIVGLFFYGFQAEVEAIMPLGGPGAFYDMAGWIWSDNYGWISLNADNCLSGGCISSGIDYSVKIDSNNNITSYGWSENVGWVCFGTTCLGTPPGGGSLTTTMDNLTGKITGWAKVESLGDDGWIKIGRGLDQGPGLGEACYDCQPECEQWTIIMVGEPPEPQEVEPCVLYSDTKFATCNTCFSQTNFDGIDYPEGQDPDPNTPDFVIGGSGNICSSCSNCHKVDGALATSRIVCNTDGGYIGQCSTCEQYGVNQNLTNGQLLGWAWNGNQDISIGAGWLHFNTQAGNSYIVFPWLQTTYGSIYTPDWFRQRASGGGNNATYCIFAKDINTNIKTQSCEELAKGLVKGVLVGFPAKSPSQEIYRNALGKIDVNGLLTKTLSGQTRNKYGQIVNELSDASWTGPTEGILKGKVYYFTGDLEIPSPIVFNNGAGVPGNGIIIVNGDLTINGEITYIAGVPNNLKELASVAWVVKGDVKINPNVTKVAGAFIVLGSGNACQIDSEPNPGYPEYIANKCGVFFSGDSDQALTVAGLIIAKAFDFRRTYADLFQGSERIIYDGRLSTNPSKGLEGFVEGLPVIRDFSY